MHNFQLFFIHYKNNYKNTRYKSRRSHYEFQNKNCCTSYERNYLHRNLCCACHSGKDTLKPEKKYIPGIYTSTLTLNNNALEVEVTVDESHINSIRFSNLDESVATMYPLIQPAIEDIAEQVYKTQSLDGIEYSSDNPYTSQNILNAIHTALEKAMAD